MKTYYYEYNGHQIGPVTFEELEKKKIEPTTLVWYEGLTEWVEAKNVADLQNMFVVNPMPPPLPAKEKATNLQNNPSLINKEIPKLPNDSLPIEEKKTSKTETVKANDSKSNSHLQIIIFACILIFVVVLIAIVVNNFKTNKTSANSGTSQVENPQIDAVSQQEQARQIEEDKRKKFIESKRSLRNSCLDYIDIKESYQTQVLGGLSNVSITVTNNLGYLIDEMYITVYYIKANGDVYTSENRYLSNLKKSEPVMIILPNSNRGKSISAIITSMQCKKIKLCYGELPFMEALANDPHLCKE
jgi:hypothetical protein